MDNRRRRIFKGLALTLGAIVVLLALLAFRDGRCGRRVRADRMINHDIAFDFGNPPCSAATRAEADVRVAYLGVGGLLIQWRGSTLVAAPYYTRQGMLEVALGEVRVDTEAIARGVAEFAPADWDVLLSGHSHYDHLADVPELMTRHAPLAELWTNRSGSNMLQAFSALEPRVHTVEDRINEWVLPTSNDDPLPFRFMPLVSDHAPHLYGFRFAHGSVEEPWSSWDGRKVRAMADGLTTSFLIDLMEGDTTVFRIHYQGSVSPAGIGHPPREVIDQRDVDLAVLCVPPYWQVKDYPEGTLAATRARHVLMIHYEDFLQPAGEPLRFVRSLTDARLDELIVRIGSAVQGTPGIAPSTPICGPSGEHWSMPLPGEWLGFDLPENAVLTSPIP